LLDVASRIEILDVSENFLTELSAGLFSFCTSLHTLRCRNNQISSLPAQISACKALQALYCDNNQIVSLPERLGACTALQVLDCKHNRLSSLPSTLGACADLEVIDCSENQVSALPKELCTCKNMHRLFCNHNNLSELPARLCLLPRLGMLECHHNPFRVGTPASLAAIRAEAQTKVVRATLMFCYEATQQDRERDGGDSTHAGIGDIALDNMREIAHFITVPPHLLFGPQAEKTVGWFW
jgi:Leucine-rich repeat (LRR) protein